jgi:putative ABC transport system permease protein
MALSSISSNYLRTFLTLLGIIVGVASVLVVSASINGAENFVLRQVSHILGNNSFILDQFGRFGYVSDEEWEEMIQRNKRLELSDLTFLRDHCAECPPLSAEISVVRTTLSDDKELPRTEVYGVTADYSLLDIFDIEEGRFFWAHEEHRGQFVCVIGSELVEEFFANVDPIEKIVRVENHPLRVIGILKNLGTNFGRTRDRVLYMPISTYQRIFGTEQSIRIRGKSADNDTALAAQDQIQLGMRIRHHLRPDEEDDFGIIGSDQVNGVVNRAANYVAKAVLPVTCISLLIGGIIIMNIMLVSVTERTFEIGIRKTLGAKNKDILSQFLIEALIMSTLGGLIGLATGWIISKMVEQALDFPMEITFLQAAFAILTAGGIGIISGLLPAYKASKLDPITSLTVKR